MERIVLLACGLLFLVSNTAEARWYGRSNGVTYTQAKPVAPVRSTTTTAQPVRVVTANYSPSVPQPVQAAPVAPAARPVQATTTYSTSTAQGVANIMASRGTVGHFGGNTGYEGCGAGASPADAYNRCCYANSGMRTVDVGYARGASGMWFCCRRYR